MDGGRRAQRFTGLLCLNLFYQLGRPASWFSRVSPPPLQGLIGFEPSRPKLRLVPAGTVDGSHQTAAHNPSPSPPVGTPGLYE
jgi:hypothetical protein